MSFRNEQNNPDHPTTDFNIGRFGVTQKPVSELSKTLNSNYDRKLQNESYLNTQDQRVSDQKADPHAISESSSQNHSFNQYKDRQTRKFNTIAYEPVLSTANKKGSASQAYQFMSAKDKALAHKNYIGSSKALQNSSRPSQKVVNNFMEEGDEVHHQTRNPQPVGKEQMAGNMPRPTTIMHNHSAKNRALTHDSHATYRTGTNPRQYRGIRFC